MSEKLELPLGQCPAEGGRAVYWAIGLYGNLTGEVIDVQDCGEVEEREQHKQESIEKGGFHLSPNPAIAEATVEYQLAANSIGEIVITNILGVKQVSYALKEGNNRVSIGNFPLGTYFVTMMVNGEAVQTQKLILQ